MHFIIAIIGVAIVLWLLDKYDDSDKKTLK